MFTFLSHHNIIKMKLCHKNSGIDIKSERIIRMNNDQISSIENTIETIEREIKNGVNLDQLSNEVGISKYHLHRLFKSITDKSLMSYVRGRKLSRSLNDLINTRLNIIDIANEYQFEHEQSYIRAFKQQFNMTPFQYRKLQCEMPIEPKIDVNHMHYIAQGLVIQPRICIKPQFYIQGIKQEIIHKENLIYHTTNILAEKFLEDYLPIINNKINEDIYIGLVIYSSNPKYSNDYIPAVETTVLNKTEAPFVNYTIPSYEYAVFRYIGFHSPHDISYETLKELYDYIMGKWKKSTAYAKSTDYHFERMDLRTCSETYCEMDVYIPISAE